MGDAWGTRIWWPWHPSPILQIHTFRVRGFMGYSLFFKNMNLLRLRCEAKWCCHGQCGWVPANSSHPGLIPFLGAQSLFLGSLWLQEALQWVLVWFFYPEWYKINKKQYELKSQRCFMSYLSERQFVYEPALWLSGFRTDIKHHELILIWCTKPSSLLAPVSFNCDFHHLWVCLLLI